LPCLRIEVAATVQAAGVMVTYNPSHVLGVQDERGLDGPNLLCAGCGAEVATQQTDCWIDWSSIRLDPGAVSRSSSPA
jgi:hypothetical protein